MKPLVAIVGRPNVGKSTLFNQLVGERLAIVEDLPGTTRDRLYADAEWNGRIFTVIDTGGLELGSSDDITARIGAQAQLAIEEADVIVLLVDSPRSASPRPTPRSPICCAARASRSCWARTRPTIRRGGRRPSSSTRWGWASRSRSPRSPARAPAICSTRSPICCPRRWTRTPTSRCRRAACRHRRTPQRRQVVAGQRHRRAGARHRQRHPRHDARHHRYRRRAQGPAVRADRHGGHSPPRAHRAGRREVQRAAGAIAPSIAPTSPC